MSKTTPSTIPLKGDFDYKELPLEAQTIYGGAIKPGMLIERTTSNTVKPHATSTGLAKPVMFAVENPIIEGRGIDDEYDTDGETVLYVVAQSGAEALALLAAGQDVTYPALLASNGDGSLFASATNPVARAIEHVDNNPGVGSAAVRIRVEVL